MRGNNLLYLTLLIAFMGVGKLYGQQANQLNAGESSKPLQFVYVLKDSLGKLSVSDIQAAAFEDAAAVQFNDAIKRYWLKIVLKNTTSTENTWLLNFDKWVYVNFYTYDSSNSVSEKITGHFVPYLQKDYPSLNRNFIKVQLKPNQQLVGYASVEASGKYNLMPETLQVTVSAEHNYLVEKQDQDNVISWFNGFFAVIFLFNLFIFVTTKDKNYVPYLVLLFFNFLLNIQNFGYNFELMKNFPTYYKWYSFSDFFLSFIFAINILWFANRFLKVKENFPAYYKVFNAILIALFVLGFVSLSGHEYLANSIGSLIGIITMLTVTIVSFKSYRRGIPSAGYFLLAQSAFVIGIIVLLCKELGIFPHTFITNYSAQIGSAMEDVLFSFALANRINILEKDNKEQREKLIMQLNENDRLQKALNIELERKVVERTKELQQSLEDLKAAQKQLIQSEKMASLGELTAGIAHEIQNPLNFVNNFSDINRELIEELKTTLNNTNGERDRDAESAILDDIDKNFEKIYVHGKRADAIVKGMLQHSRVNTGLKELTDINTLCDEYLRLSYHGLRAKDKTFNADFKTDFDESAGKINVVTQDVGRVLLNLFNNAFYAVNDKLKAAKHELHGESNRYMPTVTVFTKKLHDTIEIIVTDNGCGIPQDIVDKIFQPFFTTKPTGSGTGLGLSLSYDIIKAHGGEIKVESKENEGCKFIIRLPLH